MEKIKFRVLVLVLIIAVISSFILFRTTRKQSDALKRYSGNVYNLMLVNIKSANFEVGNESPPTGPAPVSGGTEARPGFRIGIIIVLYTDRFHIGGINHA